MTVKGQVDRRGTISADESDEMRRGRDAGANEHLDEGWGRGGTCGLVGGEEE